MQPLISESARPAPRLPIWVTWATSQISIGYSGMKPSVSYCPAVLG